MSARKFVLYAALAIAVLHVPAASARDLTFEDRVKAQEAIEQVYWNHRIWPKENPGPKPPLSAVMSDSAIRAKVEDSLRMSALLDSFWGQPLRGEQLQAEIERMVRQTKAPETLRDLFAALDDDPFLIAECLTRPALAQRLVESAFVGDERIHGAQRAALESELIGVEGLSALESVDGDHAEITFVLDEGTAAKSAPADPTDREIHLTREEWNREIGRLAATFDIAREPGIGILRGASKFSAPAGTLSTLPLGLASRLLDRDGHFVALALRAKSETSVTVVSVSWTKRTYAEWAREEVGSSTLDSSPIAPPARGYAVPALPLVGCTDDTWTLTQEEADARWRHTAVWTGAEMIAWGGYDGSAGDSGSLFSTGGRYDPSTDSWTTSSLTTGSGANVPAARFDHTAVWTGSEMIVWGGYPYTNTGGRYNPSTDSWAASSLTAGGGANVPGARLLHTAIWTGSEMIVWGGFGSTFLNTGGRYNPSTDTWAASSLTTGSGANVPTARSEHTAVWTGSQMVVWGGHYSDAGSGPLYLNTGGRYDPSTDSWVASSLTTGSGANVPTARSQHTAVWTGSQMIVWGGRYYDAGSGSLYLNTGGRYNPSADSWTHTSTGASVPAGSQDHTAVWTGSEMIVWGGSGANATGSIYRSTGGRYNPSTDMWAASSLTTGSGANVAFGRSSHTAVWTGTEMIVWGGYNGSILGTGGRYSPSTDSWAASSLTTGAARYGHTAVWTGAEMIVWGGNGSIVLRTGGRYNPATNSWAASAFTTDSGANVPTARYWHTAIWTGAEMIVWGGLNGNVVRTGGRYSPTTDSWVASSLTTGGGANVPAARYLHTAVWTGSEMIVWGGYNFSVALQTGGRYNPSTDSWTPSSLTTGSGANAPTARYEHTAVWTGSEMIVWGGNPTTNTGGRYNPAVDSWAASSLTTGGGINVPAARYFHTAIWTGYEMIAWGGYNGSASLQTGGRYNPSTDTWAASSLTTGSGANAPTARNAHTAVWTGSQMIVWGGGYVVLKTGGRYDPSTDTWAASSLTTGSGANVPAARFYHTAVWTGSEMIVWGGYPVNDSGGLYCAQGCNLQTWYQDADGDGHGSASVTQSSCTQPAGYVAAGGDCNDANPAVHPEAQERCNGIDDDCVGAVDDGGGALCNDARPCTADSCHGSSGCVNTPASGTACNDGNACTIGDECNQMGVCVGGPPLDCGDENACTTDSCSSVTGCIHTSASCWKVDFAPSTSQVPAGFVKDDGSVFSSGRGFGWNAGVGTRARNSGLPLELDTFAFSQVERTWTAEVANGNYEVCLEAGDPSFAQGPHRINANGVTLIGDVSTQANQFASSCPQGAQTPPVSVRNGRLQMVIGGTSGNTLINYLKAAPASGGSPFFWSVNFQPASSAPATGFLVDSGQVFDAARGYGWDAPLQSRERNKPVPQVLDTFVFSSAIRTWELSLPNGDYDVWYGLGDTDYAEGPHRLVVEGALVVQNLPTAAGTFIEGKTGAHLVDGRLTVQIGQGTSAVTTLNYIVVAPADIDVDGVPDGQDNCPFAYNPGQEDADVDRVGFVCDNCPHDDNPPQSDTDDDGVGNACDDNDGVIFQFAAGHNHIAWQPEVGPTSWNVYEGDLDVLRTTGAYTQPPGSNVLTERRCGVVTTWVDEFDDPPVGKTLFSLVTGVQNGVEGSLGRDSRGVERPSANPCP